MTFLDTPRFSVWLAIVVSLFTFILWCLMPTDPLVHLVEEGQLVENLTLVGYGIAILMLVLLPIPLFRLRTRIAVIVVLMAMMAREADLHKYLDHMSMLKLRFWTGSLPSVDKLYAILSLAPIIIACLYLLFRHTFALIRDLRAGKGHAATITTFVFLVGLTNLIDRSLGMIKETFGWHAPEWLVALQTSQEEFLELSLPFLAMVAAIQYRREIMRSLAAALPAGHGQWAK
ncbi:hypothetical protein [Acerihabitans arboris]|uniref:Uncharacterized protein n=1 Tax=Acerihabitans arboris TaxID=2691583 RepID=A0A845SQR0_9GAMM|nr:hypothetical protein [Acerihabitans arboris]NDL63485.1 hypothetical protein [Acerihabitans arboris]